ncbi:MAG: hypothetical protein DWQ47_05385 [Acidobacteria bacterium]|nr:MAG: hypothetical protein DWQ32_08935 [Acidobacteriota bacterium]REK01814.1 MAG: hypothetical protein DWQ38_05370 [Acidobacteriota bacterium]REK14770.1 MAG: hypothetical protein DWQ43_14625 [Acidobacteriota bacterium]REK45485.1 MAG: hypothetical protein DWQ47_05385 [Acidobacteriota bacterium]
MELQTMEELLKSLADKKIDVSFGNTAVVRGRVAGVENGLLSLDDEEGQRIYVAVDKIAFFLEASESEKKPGFLNS